MKKKVLCIALALLMCMMVALPTFADSSAETPLNRAAITVSFGLKHVSGSTYKMWAKVLNPAGENVTATLILYDSSYNYITSVSTVSSNTVFNFGKNISLSPGTYHLRLSYSGNTVSRTLERTYNI